MPKKSTAEPVPFSEVKKVMEETLLLIDQFEHGEMTSKNKAEKLLMQYRKNLQKLSKMIIGAKNHAMNQQALLVPKKNVDVVEDIAQEKKVELP